ncbi:glycosyltransferase [cf. Phormidesmis sp. LEGE 11477]|nr:glycosyltransferase [cf. Phormidesmis sp. LEGE 11477]
MHPTVSILIPCYNAEQWIAQAISSALAQTFPNKEVIVVDDGSTDASLSIIKGFGGTIRWESGPNKGGNAARNRLLALSTGRWLQYLDADDYLLPQKIEEHIGVVRREPEADVIYSPSVIEYRDGTDSSHEIRKIPTPKDPFVLLALWHLPQTGSPLWRKRAIVDVGCWKDDQPCCQEHELYLRLLKANKRFVYCSHASSIYRQWSEETVCKRDMPEVFRQRLAVEDSLEAYLKKTDQLTPVRQQAINQARFECARLIWLFDPVWAKRLISRIHCSQRKFVPTGASAPALYRFAYHLAGFSRAENIAYVKRSLMGR